MLFLSNCHQQAASRHGLVDSLGKAGRQTSELIGLTRAQGARGNELAQAVCWLLKGGLAELFFGGEVIVDAALLTSTRESRDFPVSVAYLSADWSKQKSLTWL